MGTTLLVLQHCVAQDIVKFYSMSSVFVKGLHKVYIFIIEFAINNNYSQVWWKFVNISEGHTASES
jgi:hypothetical protein